MAWQRRAWGRYRQHSSAKHTSDDDEEDDDEEDDDEEEEEEPLRCTDTEPPPTEGLSRESRQLISVGATYPTSHHVTTHRKRNR